MNRCFAHNKCEDLLYNYIRAYMHAYFVAAAASPLWGIAPNLEFSVTPIKGNNI